MSNLADLVKTLAKSDGSTSTNYGATFELSALTLCLLNCCKQKKKVKIWANKTEYNPWDDLVIEIDNQIICVQLKHTKEFHEQQFEDNLKDRKLVIERNQLENASVIFVYFSISSAKKVLQNYTKIEENPDVLNFLITNNKFMYLDQNFETPSYFCMKQHNIINLETDIRNVLKDYIAIEGISRDFLKTIQVVLNQYIQIRYQRLVKQNDPLTSEELSEQLGYIILNKFKIPFTPATNAPTSNNLLEILTKSDIVVLDHRINSIVKSDVWNHVLHALKRDSKKIKQQQIDALWISGKIHMPIFSPDYLSDREIARALDLLQFSPKVLILRPRMFHIRKEQKVYTILQNIDSEKNSVFLTSGEKTESFKYVFLELGNIKNTRNLHQDLFCKLAKKYTNKSILEGHDEFSYVNDVNVFGEQADTALIACMRIPEIGLHVIKHLIDLGANVNATIAGGHGPLYFALKANRLDIMQILLQHNANPDAADKYGNSPLLYAISDEKPEMVQMLVNFNANKATADFYGDSAVFWAYKAQNYEIMAILMTDFDKAAAANAKGSHILHRSAEENNVDCLKCVIQNCPDIHKFMTGDFFGNTPLDIARQRGHTEFVNILEKVTNL